MLALSVGLLAPPAQHVRLYHEAHLSQSEEMQPRVYLTALRDLLDLLDSAMIAMQSKARRSTFHHHSL